MKTKFLAHTVISFIVCLCITSCSEEEMDSSITSSITNGIPVSVELDSRSLPANMKCNLYVFRKALNESVYTLNEIIPFGNESIKEAQFTSSDLNTHDYRLFFIAIPSDYNNELSVSGINVGDAWESVKITASTYQLSDNFYYQTLTTPGSQILSEGRVKATLGRLVGQMAIDIYHLDGNGNPDTIRAASVASVLDRVKQINLNYSGLTKEIIFDADGNPQESDTFAETYSQVIKTTFGSSFIVNVDEQDEQWITQSGNQKPGSVRIKGFYCLPATKKIRIHSEFEYVDTTPKCENNHEGTHTEDCYPAGVLTLHLPKENETTELLTIKPNHFTVNKAGIWLNRIIDVLQEGSLGFNLEWANEKNNG